MAERSKGTWTEDEHRELVRLWNHQLTSETEAEKLNSKFKRDMGSRSWDVRIVKAVGREEYDVIMKRKKKNPQPDLPNVEKIEVPDDRWNSMEAKQQKKIEANPTRLAIDFNRIVEVSLTAGVDRYVEKYIMLSEYTKILTENESLQRKLEKFEEMESFMEGYKKFLRKLGSVEEFSPKVVEG